MSTPADFIDELRKKYANHDTTNFVPEDFFGAFGCPVDAIMYISFFWPEFIEFDGMVFRQETIEEVYSREEIREALNKSGGDKPAIEESFNIMGVPYMMFSKGTAETSEEMDEFLAEKLAEMWRCRLAMVFPDRKFVVEVIQPEENNDEFAVTFYTRPDQA